MLQLIALLSNLQANLDEAVYAGGILNFLAQKMQMKTNKIQGRLNKYFKEQYCFIFLFGNSKECDNIQRKMTTKTKNDNKI